MNKIDEINYYIELKSLPPAQLVEIIKELRAKLQRYEDMEAEQELGHA